jgi:uncharacterized protein YjbI with pentapeptide repeats
MDNTPAQAAHFRPADLSEASITVHFSYDELRRANSEGATLTGVKITPRLPGAPSASA